MSESESRQGEKERKNGQELYLAREPIDFFLVGEEENLKISKQNNDKLNIICQLVKKKKDWRQVYEQLY